MDTVLGMTLCWLAFAGTHMGIASRPVRDRIVARVGELGFAAAFSSIAVTTFTCLVAWYATHRTLGPAGPALGGVPALRAALMAVVVTGVVIAACSLASYPGSPYALLRDGAAPGPRGIARVTRHGFFVGVALVALAHTLLATRLVSVVFALGFAVLTIAGGLHQDRKLLARRGADYAGYLAETSFVPFVAILAGRQRFVWREIARPVLVGLAAAVCLRSVHAHLFDGYGAWVIGATVGGAALATVQAVRAQRRRDARAATPRAMSATMPRAAATGSGAAAMGRPTTR